MFMPSTKDRPEKDNGHLPSSRQGTGLVKQI